jgi:hypothetical protein
MDLITEQLMDHGFAPKTSFNPRFFDKDKFLNMLQFENEYCFDVQVSPILTAVFGEHKREYKRKACGDVGNDHYNYNHKFWMIFISGEKLMSVNSNPGLILFDECDRDRVICSIDLLKRQIESED